MGREISDSEKYLESTINNRKNMNFELNKRIQATEALIRTQCLLLKNK